MLYLQIAIETTPFPKGAKGDSLDNLARQFLYADGLNFGHGVGHGIGSYLGVSCDSVIAPLSQADHLHRSQVHEGMWSNRPTRHVPYAKGLSRSPGYTRIRSVRTWTYGIQ
jgi:hypothetical protein